MRTPWSDLADRVAGGGVVAGVLSGTSADGIDVGLMRFEPASHDVGPPELLAFETLAFEAELAGRLRAALAGSAAQSGAGSVDGAGGVDSGGLGPAALARLDRDLGRAFGAAARELARARELPRVLIGSHGQTVWHHDGDAGGAATLQLGCAAELAETAGCAVASDFRRTDIAAGGEGAPLAPLADPLLFGSLPRPGAILNLGGIANLTWLDAAGSAGGFDTGPAGSLLDGLARRLLGRPLDRDGAAARSGRVHAGWVDELCTHPFLLREPPKSTGRDTFGEAWVDQVLARARARGLSRDADVLASAVDFVARHVAAGLRRLAVADPAAADPEAGPATTLAVAGGGLHNRALFEALGRHCPGPVRSSADFGVDPDAREALLFGVLGARCALGVPSPTTAGQVGTAAARVLGRLSALPPVGPAD